MPAARQGNVFVFGLIFLFTVAKADLPETIEQIKPSVVAVGTYKATDSPPFTFRGTGFAFGNGQQIATNAHVPPETSSDAKLVVLVTPNRTDRQLRSVKILSKDSEHDIAVLLLDRSPIQPLQLGDPSTVKEGRVISITGFPIGGALGFSPVTHRGMRVIDCSDRAAQWQLQSIDRLANSPIEAGQI